VLAISLLAAPLVVPPAVVILPGLLVFAVAERAVSLVVPTRGQEVVLRTPPT
jgi:hypothetical protein